MPIRLNGLAAPEGDEPGGEAATRAMVELVDGRTLRCELNGRRTYDRCVGQAAVAAATIGRTYRLPGYCRER
jgi:micrococcal nuclease